MKTCVIAALSLVLTVMPCTQVPTGSSPVPTPAALLGSAGSANGWRSMATLAENKAKAASVEVWLTVKGPLQVQGGCTPSLEAWMVDSGGATVAQSAPPKAQCLVATAVEIPARSERTFSTSLAKPSAPGTFLIHGRLHLMPPPGGFGDDTSENLPVIAIRLA